MAAFQSNYNSHAEVMAIKLDHAFSETDWSEVVDYYKKKVADGFQKWELDLTDLPFISSNSIGMLIALNTSIMANTGSFQVILPNQSHVANQIRFARIDQILNCRFA